MSDPERGGDLSRRLFFLGLAAVTLLATWLVWPAFEPGRIINLDAPRHLLRSVVMAKQFLPSGHVDGWSPWWYLGAQLFLFQSYGYFLVIGGAALMLEHFATIESVFKFFYVLPIVALPAAVAFLSRRLGLSRGGALASSVVCLAFGSPLGYGLQGMFGIGLLLQGIGILAFALAWPFVLEAVVEAKRPPWFAILLLAAVLLLHFISGAFALAAAGVVAAGAALWNRDARPLLRYALLATLVLLLAGHSLFPSLEWRELAGSPVGWGQEKDRFHRFLAGTLFGARPLALLCIAAAAASIALRRGNLAITAMVLFGTALLGGANRQGWEPTEISKLLDVLVRPRALPYAALLLSVFAGAGFDFLRRAVEAASSMFGDPRWLRAVVPVTVAAFGFVAWSEMSQHRHFVRTESTLDDVHRDPYRKLVGWLRENVEPPAIVTISRRAFDSRSTGARSVVSLLNLDTGLYTLGGDQAELTTAGNRFGRADLDRIDQHPSRYAKILRGAGVSIVVVTDPDVRAGVADQRDFELVYEYDAPRVSMAKKGTAGFGVFRVRNSGSRIHGSGLEVSDFEEAPERLSFRLRVRPGLPTRPVTASVSWHPNWTATVDGVAVPVTRTKDEKVAFEVPVGVHRVTVEYVRRPREHLYDGVSAASLLFVVSAWGFGALRRRRTAA